MVDRAKEAPVCGAEVGSQGKGRHACQILVAGRRVGKLDCDRVKAALWHMVVQLLNGTLSLATLVKPDESHTLGEA